MNAQQNNLMLFGFDLRFLGRFFALAVRQLLFDPSSWLAKRFQPPLWVLNGDQWYRCRAGHLSISDPPASVEFDEFYGISIPDEAVLFKRIKLPSSSEMFLSDAVALEVGGCSPFPAGDLVFGSRIASRGDASIDVVIAMTTHQAVAAAQARGGETRLAGDAASVMQVCAVVDGQQLVEFDQYRDPARTSAYIEILKNLARRSLVAATIVVTALAVPAGSSAYRAARLVDDYGELRQNAQRVDDAVEMLHLQRAVLMAVSEEVEVRPDYAFWLNHIASGTPDNTRLQRLSIEQGAVQVLGYSDNAANYLRLLTEEPAYSGVSARSAFVRDSRSEKERFQIDWSLVLETL
jgi:hypothetical protein